MNNTRQVIISKQIYQYGDQNLEYTLVRTKRRKTSELIVDENEVMLRVPFNKTITDAEKLMSSKIRWVIRKQKEYGERIPEIIKPNFLQGSTVPYLGKNYEIHIIKHRNNGYDKIELVNNKFIVTLYFKKNNQNGYDSRMKSLYEDWLYTQASNILKEKIRYFSSTINVIPKKIVVKKLRNRWGSTTKEGTVNINFNLIKASEDVIDYVIIHELCHLIIKNHSHHFWSLLKKYATDYKTKIEWLEINGKNMIESKSDLELF